MEGTADSLDNLDEWTIVVRLGSDAVEVRVVELSTRISELLRILLERCCIYSMSTRKSRGKAMAAEQGGEQVTD